MTPTSALQQGSFLVDKFKPTSMKGVDVVFADIPGRNTNVYPEKELITAVEYYKKLIQLDPTYKYAFAKHPKDVEEEWIGLIAGVIDDIYYNSNKKTLQADFTLLPTIWGNFIAWLIDNGHHVGISLRGKADGTSSVTEMNGKSVAVTMRSNLKLEGIDFVLHPSYIITNVSKKNVAEQAGADAQAQLNDIFFNNAANVTFSENKKHKQIAADVFESYIKDTSQKYDIAAEEIIKLFSTNVQESTRRDDNMAGQDTIDVREAQLKVERLSIEQDKMEQRKVVLTSEIEASVSEIEAKKQLLSDLDKKITDKQTVVAGLNSLQETLTEKQLQLEAIEEKLATSAVDLKKMQDEYATVKEQADSETFVRMAGKSFSSSKPPKIRIVTPDQRVTNTSWDVIRKNNIKQLVALTQDQNIANQVFCYPGQVNNWESLELPVYQPLASESEDFDIDLVLNRKAMQQAVDMLLGRTGLSFTKEQKTKAITFLKDKYMQLESAGISETPEALTSAAQNMDVILKLKLDEDDDYIESMLESALMNGVVAVEAPADKISESTGETEPTFIDVKREVAYDNFASAIMNTLLGVHKGKITEQVDPNQIPTSEAAPEQTTQTFINTLLTSADGAPTEFATTLGIETAEDFTNKFITPLSEAFNTGDSAAVFALIKPAVIHYTNTMCANDGNAANVGAHIAKAFDTIAQLMPQTTEQENEIPEEIPPQEPAVPPVGGEQEPVMEQTNMEDDMLFDELKQSLEGNFEGVVIENAEDVKSIIAKLVTDYTTAYTELNDMKTAQTKTTKTAELVQAGVSESVISQEFEAAQTPEEVIASANRMLAIIATQRAEEGTSVQESSSATAADPVEIGKSVMNRGTDEAPATQSAPRSAFDRAMLLV